MLQPQACHDPKKFLTTPEIQKVHVRDNEKQEEALNTSPEFSYISRVLLHIQSSPTYQLISFLIKEARRLPEISKLVHFDLEPMNTLEIQEILNSINPKASSVLIPNHNSVNPPINPIQEPSREVNKFIMGKIGYCCNHFDVILLSQN